MRVIDLLVVYLGVGVVCAITVGRLTRGHPVTAVDRVMVVFVWPLYVPALLAPAPLPAAGTRIEGSAAASIRVERAALVAAVEAMAHTPVAACLPSRAQLEMLVSRIDALDAKVAELDAVLARDEFDGARAAQAVHHATRDGGTLLESAVMVQRSIERLGALRATAGRERDELLALCGRLRTQLTVLRFAERPGTDEVGGLVEEILARVDAVGATLEPAIE